MMTQWHEFLAGRGATLAEGRVSDFGDAGAERQALADGNVLVDLSHLGLLQLEGDDAVTFLQGQVTNDVRQLDGSHSHYSGYCTPKGRMLAMLLAFAHEGRIHLQLDGALLAPIMKRLRMYVLRSKVTVTDVSDEIVRFGVAGERAAESLKQMFPELPQQPHTLTALEKGVLLRLPGSLPRYEIFTRIDQAPAMWNVLAEHHRPVGYDGWEWLEIEAGIPDVVPATQEAFVPQMLNLDALGGINFKKGCYTGQEIVARTHYLGKVKRRTQLAHIAGETRPRPGDTINGADGAEAGLIVRAAPAPGGGYDVLAEVRLESLQAGTIRWREQELQLRQLPYALE